MSHSRSRPALTLLAIVTAIGLCSVVLTLSWASSNSIFPVGPALGGVHDDIALVTATPAVVDVPTELERPSEPVPDPWRAKVMQWVNGEPTDNFQDNLRSDIKYVTSWVSGGWTNDFMTYINMVYLGLLTDRTPVLPPFAPSHVAYEAGFPAFGDVFDVPRMSAEIGSPLLEWRDVKKVNSSATDEVGCWSTWAFTSQDKKPRHSSIPDHLKLAVSYTALPPRSARVPNMPNSHWLLFSSLADVATQPALHIQPFAQSPAQPSTGMLPPDAHLACFDFMYYVGAVTNDEWWYEWSPAWRIVGRHAHWAPSLERIARGYVARALGILEDEEQAKDFPPFISVHVRRGDFTAACGHAPKDECFPPLSAYARRVLEIRGFLLSQREIDVPPSHVLVTSDEKNAGWWEEVAALGWRRVDHERERTAELLGGWGAPLVDAVVQSGGVGFVGTDRSTMSMVARRRVEDWRGGVGYLVRIGGRNADD